MPSIQQIEEAREAILKEMRSIQSMKKGSVTEQFLKVKHKGKKEPVLRGPYFVFTRKEGKKTVGYRLRTAAEQESVRRDVAAHKRFVALCRQFEDLTEKLGEMEHDESSIRQEKKRRSSPSSRTRK